MTVIDGVLCLWYTGALSKCRQWKWRKSE